MSIDHMKPFLLIALLLAPCSVLAGEQKDEPAELARARKAYEAQVRTITAPARQQYLQQLEDMRAQMGSRGNAPAAIAILDEINKVRGESGMSPAFDWQKLRHATSYSYSEPGAFAKSGAYVDDHHTKLLDGLVGETFSPQSVGWVGTRPSPIVFQFTRPLKPNAISLYILGSSVHGGVEMPKTVRVYSGPKSSRDDLIGERTKIPDHTGWLDIPLALRTPVEKIRVEIEPSGAGYTILEEVEFK